MADYSKKPSDPREPLLFRLNATAWGYDPASPAGGGGNGYFVCRLSTGCSATVNAYDPKPGPLSAKVAGGFDDWWDDWWGEIEKSWDKTRADVADWFERAGQVKLAFDLAFTGKRVVGAIEKETGMLAAALPAALYIGLKQMAEVLVASTLTGAVVGGVLTIEAGGGGAIPGGMLGFELGVLYLEVTGLAEVAKHVADNIDEVMKRMRLGAERAWNAGRYSKSKLQDIQAAADIMAGSIGVLFRLVLEAIAAAILVKGIGKTTSSLAKGQFGKEFALWVEQNQKALTTNPKLKAKAKSKGVAAEGTQSGASKGSSQQPKSKSPQAGGQPAKNQKAETLKQNKASGKLREEQVKAELEAEGHEVLGSQVSVKTSKTRRVVDHLIRDKTTGEIRAVEVKSGNATRNTSQLAKDAAMESEGGTIIGKNAPPGLVGQKIKIKTEVRK